MLNLLIEARARVSYVLYDILMCNVELSNHGACCPCLISFSDNLMCNVVPSNHGTTSWCVMLYLLITERCLCDMFFTTSWCVMLHLLITARATCVICSLTTFWCVMLWRVLPASYVLYGILVCNVDPSNHDACRLCHRFLNGILVCYVVARVTLSYVLYRHSGVDCCTF
jgi:hypothetical protein